MPNTSRSAFCGTVLSRLRRPSSDEVTGGFGMTFAITAMRGASALTGTETIRRESLVRSNFERYFAPQLAARIASSGEALKLGGDKRQVAVLFSAGREDSPALVQLDVQHLAKVALIQCTEYNDLVDPVHEFRRELPFRDI